MYVLDEINSSLIRSIEYDEVTLELTIFFRKYYVDSFTYEGVGPKVFDTFTTAKSHGKFYLEFIKPNFKIKQIMPDKIIRCKINVQDIKKEWLFPGQKGTYLNLTILFNETQNQHGQNGMIVQDVPTDVYKADKTVKGPILGNCAVWGSGGPAALPEQKVGVETGAPGLSAVQMDDLPF